MRSLAEDHRTQRDVCIEIRSRWPSTPACSRSLRRLGLSILDANRLFRIETAEDLEPAIIAPEHARALFDPLTEDARWDQKDRPDSSVSVDVFCKPGVTDAEGETAARALALAGLPGCTCYAGMRYRLAGDLGTGIRPVVERLIGNPLIHQFSWWDHLDLAGAGNSYDRTAFCPGNRLDSDALDAAEDALADGPRPAAATIELGGLDDRELLNLSRRHGLALSLTEMRAIVSHFAQLERMPTDVELHSLALTWSEHCSHTTFKATIDFECDGRRESIPGLLPTCIAAPTAALARPWVRSAFTDNAGIIAFDDAHDLSFKVETHNHPSALEPFGGAHTGVGGVIRDILAVSAEPIANTDVLCFGPGDLPDDEVPAGVFHPAVLSGEVVRGIADYGNNMGIPTVGGAIFFHPGYTANPLVYCGTLGLAPRGRHPTTARAGDTLVVLGGRTGRDGLQGATMSSAQLDRDAVQGTVVQIGNPITEKEVRDVLPHLRDEGLYHAITDCGAGGLCSGAGEMGATLGIEVDLARVPLKYEGLRPWEIWLSEAQERMVLAVPPTALPRVVELCRLYGVEATSIGAFREDGIMRLSFNGQVVADLDMAFLHGGRPPVRLAARWTTPAPAPDASSGDVHGPEESLLGLLAHPNIASKEDVIRQYDHEVGGGTIVKPLVGDAGPSDAAVVRPVSRSWRGVVVAHGINPLYGVLDPYVMAMLAVDESLRNVVAVGGSIDRAAMLDNFCWGNIDDPGELGSLVRAAQGCRDAALGYGVPFISGKDSLRNTSVDGSLVHSIPPTLLISAVGVIPDVRHAVTMDLKAAGNHLYLLGNTDGELGGSHYLWMHGLHGGRVPKAHPKETRMVMRRLTRAIRAGLVSSCHDLSEGGLAVAAAEMAIAGGIGLEINLDGVLCGQHLPVEEILFAESPGRFLVEVAPDKAAAFDGCFERLPYAAIGQTQAPAKLVIGHDGRVVIDLTAQQISGAWRGA